MTNGVGTITPAKFGGSNNPLTVLEKDTDSVLTFGNSLPFNLIGPYEVRVINDYWEYCQNCETTVQRNTQYKVISSDGSPAANIPIGEIMGPLTDYNCSQATSGSKINSCTLAKGTTTGSGVTGIKSDGMGATDANGEFVDAWTVGSDTYTPVGCGAHRVDQWQLCGLAQVTDDAEFQQDSQVNWGLTFAGLSGFIHTNETSFTVNGMSYELPGTGICGPDYYTCPDRIPAGTIITPSN